mmetsp:Transcript_12139/g.25558  ORF Transcript_12139/g.25558 Transcript_12139/m.25558 type:complete len:113 (-) Transcript_12139:579-917(-)
MLLSASSRLSTTTLMPLAGTSGDRGCDVDVDVDFGFGFDSTVVTQAMLSTLPKGTPGRRDCRRPGGGEETKADEPDKGMRKKKNRVDKSDKRKPRLVDESDETVNSIANNEY